MTLLKQCLVAAISAFVAVVSQTRGQVTCSALIGFPAQVLWIDSNSCILPADSNIPFNFMNVSNPATDGPYFLECSGQSITIDINQEIECFCNYIFGDVLLDTFFCRGFVFSASESGGGIDQIPAIVVPLVVIILLLVVSVIAAVIIIVYCVLTRIKKNARDSQPEQINLTSEPSEDPQRTMSVETRYAEINFGEYEYVDSDVAFFYSSGASISSEELYQRIKQGGPGGPLYESIADHIGDIRRTDTATNRSGTVSHIVVPTSQQRRSVLMSVTSNASFGEYLQFNSSVSGELSRQTSANPIYMEPASNVGDLYDQMSNGKLLEINRGTITIGSKLGSGEFGSVRRGVWACPVGDLNVALKILKNEDEQMNTAFLQEAAILGQFSHPNILRLVGVVTLTAPNMIVTELMQEELKRFLLALQTQHKQDLDYDTLAPHFLSFSRQVASGMQHLAQRECIHRDIAARNILLTDKCVCKIGDFGMSRRLETESDYYRVTGSNKLPVKWSAPEAIFFKRFTLKSDVWSYGMLLYEIWSVGRKPWPYEDNRGAVEKMARAVNLPPPAGCPRPLYQLMVSTWHPSPDKRVDMNEVVARLSLSDQDLLARPELEGKEGANAPAFALGADPMAAEEMYKDLQEQYVNLNS